MAAQRRYDKLHEALPFHDGTETSWVKEASASHPYRYDDGVNIWVADRDVNPDDDFLSGVPQGVADEERGEGG